MCGNSAHISRRFTKSANVNYRNPLVLRGDEPALSGRLRLGSIRTFTLESQIAMTGDIALSAGGRLDNPLYILFCQLTSLLVGLSTLFFSFVDCLSRISPTNLSSCSVDGNVAQA